MPTAIEQSIRDTQQAFMHGVWPQVSARIGGGRIIPVEAVADKEFLDQYSGIDHWHVLADKGLIRGIASRCQWPVSSRFQTFTIRIGNKCVEKTELAKRLYAMEHSDKGFVRPHLFVQAYFAQPKPSYDGFLYAGVAKLDDILTIIRDGIKGDRRNTGDWWQDATSQKWGNTDAKQFAVVPFASLTKRRCDFMLIDT
jgi:hypothetical protein